MHISLTGSIGIGIVWGWVIDKAGGPGDRSIQNSVTLSLITLLEALVIFLMTGLRASVFYVFALIFGLVINFSWHSMLRRNPKI